MVVSTTRLLIILPDLSLEYDLSESIAIREIKLLP